jgi:hypothetical protein
VNPIQSAIDSKDEDIVKVIIDYCLRSSHKLHPGYLTPAVQCMDKLTENYPEILRDMFQRASYIPAPYPSYVASRAIVANRDPFEYISFLINVVFWFWQGFHSNSKNINNYEKPVFSLLSQLPIRSVHSKKVLSIGVPYFENRVKEFPDQIEIIEEQQRRIQTTNIHSIYVCPFPKFSFFSRYSTWYNVSNVKSTFTSISGRDFFDSQAMAVTLRFKW